jgi:phosphatidate cytidylyltransferase
MMSQLYIALPFALLNGIAFIPYPMGPLGTVYIYMYPLAVFLFLWSSDTGAYCVGSLLSKKIPYKLFPSISPNKSWVGSIGGTLLAVAVAAIVSHFEPSLTLLQWIGSALVVAIFGTWGDLVESQIKRQLGIKDSGNILPGHGGFLDRFDSSLLAIPASLLYLSCIWTL